MRPELADRLVDALNAGETPPVRTLGSVGAGATSRPLAELAAASSAPMALEPGEGTALLDNNAFSTGWAALAVADAATLLDALDVAGALSLEGIAANPTMLHAAIGEVRPYPGLAARSPASGACSPAARCCDAGVARHLQDPLSFRNLPQVRAVPRATSWPTSTACWRSS